MLALLTPAQLIESVLQCVAVNQRGPLLRLLKAHSESQLKQLSDARLAYVERGRDDEWQALHTRTTETLAETERALATC